MQFEIGKTYRIVGVGADVDVICKISGSKATGYVEDEEGNYIPVDLSLFGPGEIGKEAQLLTKTRGG